jgi:outer membrane protein assembly factor BamB
VSENSQYPRRMRWWIPGVLVGIALMAVVWLRVRETPFIEQITLGICVLTALSLVIWYIFLTGLRWKTRFLLAGAAALLIAGVVLGVRALTRVEGSIGGSGVPRLVWKWSPRPDASAGPLQVASNTPPAAAGAPGPSAPSFPQFLGPNRSGVLQGVSLVRDWAASPPRLLWRRAVGVGWSAFAVSAGRAITQEQRGEEELTVAYDLSAGTPLWAHTNRVRFSETLGGDGPRATPTIRDGRVYVMGATGILDCLDETNGRLLWSRDVLREHKLKNVTWGKSCSPLLFGRLVVVTGGEEREKSLLAYDARDGQPVWQTGRDRASYCSPMVATLDGQEQILIVNGRSVSGHHPEDGRVLWEYPWPGEFPKVAQPLPLDANLLLVATGYGVGCSLLKLQPSAGGEWSVTEVWKNRNLKPKFTNLVRHGSHAYGLDDGVLVCLDPATGQRVWKDGRYGHGQILLVEDVLLIQTEGGDVVLVDATPEGHRERARLAALKTKTWNNPVLAGDLLLVRNDQEAACYRLSLVKGAAAESTAAR